MVEQQVDNHATDLRSEETTTAGSGGPRSFRRSFLRKAAAIAAVTPAAMIAGSRSSMAGGPRIHDLYPDWTRENFETIQSDENAHVNYLRTALGADARPMPNFQNLQQSNEFAFADVSRDLENTGVGAYLGALPTLIQIDSAYATVAMSIGLMEARHAGFLNTLIDLPVNENILGAGSFDILLSPQQVVALAGPFFVDLNGGPPLIPVGGFTMGSQILNFALALEYLEAAYYNINVPIFFPPPGERRPR